MDNKTIYALHQALGKPRNLGEGWAGMKLVTKNGETYWQRGGGVFSWSKNATNESQEWGTAIGMFVLIAGGLLLIYFFST